MAVSITGVAPSFNEERALESLGYRYIAGVDEAGRGPLAGPVVAGAVILPMGLNTPWTEQVRDSKVLTAPVRERLFRQIHETAVAVGVGICNSDFIDARGIVNATHLAMRDAIAGLQPPAESLLIDYLTLPGVSLPQKGITRGDSLSVSIACASIVAKVTRDRLMAEYESVYPGYGFHRHKGYGTPEHLSCLQRLGPCPIHRHSFRPVREAAVR